MISVALWSYDNDILFEYSANVVRASLSCNRITLDQIKLFIGSNCSSRSMDYKCGYLLYFA